MKKFITVLLSILLAVSSFGAVLASAGSNEEASAAAQEYNSSKADYSELLPKYVSEKTLLNLIAVLDDKATELLAGVDLEAEIYSDSAVTAIARKIAGLLNTNLASSVDAAALAKDFPEAAEYIQGKDWDDAGTIPFGINGDKELFIKAVGAGCANFGSVIALLNSMDSAGNGDLYNKSFVPLLESLHVRAMPDAAGFISKTAFNGTLTMSFVAEYITKAVDAFQANPVEYVTDVLPDFIYSFAQFKATLEANPLVAMFGVSIPGLDSIVSGLLANIEGIDFPEIDYDALAGMATATVEESGAAGGYDIRLNGDKQVVFFAVVNYVTELVEPEENKIALGRLAVTNLGITNEEYEQFIDACKANDAHKIVYAACGIIDAVIEKIIPAQEGFIAMILNFFRKIAQFFRVFFGAFMI